MLNIAVIEDCENDQIHINEMISKYFFQKSIRIHITNFSLIPKDLAVLKNIDLLFLDLHVEKENGIEFGKRLISQYPDLMIVITSNHPQYLIDGYSIHAQRYFLKPVDPEIFAFEMDEVLASSRLARKQGISDIRIAPYKVYFEDIVSIEYRDRKTIIQLENGNTYSTTISLREWRTLLQDQTFAQPYKCFLVNLHFVSSVLPRDVIVNNTVIPLSKHYRQAFLAALDQVRRGVR